MARYIVILFSYLIILYIRDSGNGAWMMHTIFSNFSASKHLKTANLQHIPVTIIKGIHVFHCRLYGGNTRPVVPLKIILLSGELINSALIKNVKAIAASMIKVDVTSFINTTIVYIRTLLRDVNNDVTDGKCTSASYFWSVVKSQPIEVFE